MNASQSFQEFGQACLCPNILASNSPFHTQQPIWPLCYISMESQVAQSVKRVHYRLDDQDSNPSKCSDGNCSLHYHVQTSYEAHTTSYQMVPRGLLPRGQSGRDV